MQAASLQDRDGAPLVLRASHARFPFIQKSFTDSIYPGWRVATAAAIMIEILRELPDQAGFKVVPRHWLVERFFAWIDRN